MNNLSQVLTQLVQAQQPRPQETPHQPPSTRPYLEATGESTPAPSAHRAGEDVSGERADGFNSRFARGETPFSRRLMDTPMPRKLNLPKLEQYDGTTDPEDHLIHYQNCMTLQNGVSEAVLCRAFMTCLKGPALSWFNQLPPRSVDSFCDLTERFATRFVASKRMRRAPIHLLTIRQKAAETLRQYVARFSSEITTVDGCGDDFIVAAMARGLRDGRLADSMFKHPPTTTGQMLKKAQEYIKLEECKSSGQDCSPTRPQDVASTSRGELDTGKRPRAERIQDRVGVPDRGAQARSSQAALVAGLGLCKPLDHVYQEIKNKFSLRQPAPLKYPMDRRDKSKFCDFHNEIGHRTDECKNLAWEIEGLIKSGKLKEYLQPASRREKVARVSEAPHHQDRRERSVSRHEGARREDRQREDREGSRRREDREGSRRNTIYVIHALTESAGLSSTERKRKLHQLFHLSSSQQSRQEVELGVPITFSDADCHGVTYPHDDALVVSVKVGGFDVRRVLVDSGSSVNILYHHAFLMMKLDETQVTPTSSVMAGFAGETSQPLGKIVLPVQVGAGKHQKAVLAVFFIIKSDSPYNAILGRTYLHAMKALASSYHQCMKFPVSGEVGTLIGNQLAARQCITAALKPHS